MTTITLRSEGRTLGWHPDLAEERLATRPTQRVQDVALDHSTGRPSLAR